MSMNIHAKKGDKKYQFTNGDGVKGLTKEQHSEIIYAWQRNFGDMVYLQPSDTQEYNAVFHNGKLEIGFVNVTNPIPYNDMICLIKGELPDEWCIECTNENIDTKEWGDFIRSVSGHLMVRSYPFYGMENISGTGSDAEFGTTIQFSTWVALNELNSEPIATAEWQGANGKGVEMSEFEPTLEQQVNECKEQTEDVAFIAIEDGRLLLKIDQQGFVTIGETVVGHEPGLPKYFEQDLTDSGFNPELPFIFGGNNRSDKEFGSHGKAVKYIGRNASLEHVLEFYDGSYQTFSSVENIKKPELVEGDSIWFKRPYEHDWQFGFFITKSAVMVNSGTRTSHEGTYQIRPFFVDGVAQYPPFV